VIELARKRSVKRVQLGILGKDCANDGLIRYTSCELGFIVQNTHQLMFAKIAIKNKNQQ